ncbi:Aconitate hydratase mitochondrial, partial [Naganishia albida]
ADFALFQVLALWFQNPADYDKISGTDKISILGLDKFAPGEPLDVEITHKDGSKEQIKVNHTFNAGQIEFFKAGSALNLMAAAAKKRAQQ